MKTHAKFFAIITSALAIALSGCGGGDTHQKVADDVFKVMERMSNAMGSITDKASAEKAVAEMKTVAGDMKSLGERAKKLGEPSGEVKTELEASMKAKTEELQKKMAGSMMKIAAAGPEAMEVLQAGMKEIGPSMEEAGKLFK